MSTLNCSPLRGESEDVIFCDDLLLGLLLLLQPAPLLLLLLLVRLLDCDGVILALLVGFVVLAGNNEVNESFLGLFMNDISLFLLLACTLSCSDGCWIGWILNGLGCETDAPFLFLSVVASFLIVNGRDFVFGGDFF